MTRHRDPTDVKVRRFIWYWIRRSGGRDVWVGGHGERIASRYGFPLIRRLLS